MAETVRLRLLFDGHRMLTKSRKREGLKRSWFLLKPQLNTISDLASHLQSTFRLHRTCPNGIILLMDGFVLPSFESTCILKDKDIVCVKRKGSISGDDKPAMLPYASPGDRSIEVPKLLAIKGFQEETGGDENVSQYYDSDHFGGADQVEAKSKKRKASKKLKSPSQKKIKMSNTERLVVTPEVHNEENGSSQGHIHHYSNLAQNDNSKSSDKSSPPNKSSKKKNDKSEPTSDETRSLQPQDESGTKKLPSRSARRKKAKRRWLRELKLEKEKLDLGPVLEKDEQLSPIKDCIVSDVHQQSSEESEAEDDIVPVEIRPGHIRFQPLKKDQTVPQNQFPVETFQWNGITSKKKGQKWGKEKISSRKQDDYERSSQECTPVLNAETKHTFNAVDFEKLTPITSVPKEGDVIAYRLIELSASWTPELSSFRVGKISQYDAKSNRIWLEPVIEFPFDFEKKIDDDGSFVQSDPAPYQEDGSLEIDYASLADVRMVRHGHSDLATVVASSDALVNSTKATNGVADKPLAADQTTTGNCKPEREGHIPARVSGKVNVWDEINEALNAKKAKLSQEDGWSKVENSGTRSWSYRALRCSALGPTMAILRSQNGL